MIAELHSSGPERTGRHRYWRARVEPCGLLEHNGGGLEADFELRDLVRDESGGVYDFEGVVGAEDSVRGPSLRTLRVRAQSSVPR